MSFQMFVPTKALFGAGQLNHLHEQDLPGKKALLVISNGKSTKVNGYLDRTEKELHTAGVETVLFDQVEANPLKSTVMRGGAMALSFVRRRSGDGVDRGARVVELRGRHLPFVRQA